MTALELKAVLWDLDGTVVDSEPAWFAAELVLAERFGAQWANQDAKSLVGADLYDTAKVLQAAGVDLDSETLVNALLDLVIEKVLAAESWQPGVLEALASCREAGLDCALVSMSWRRFTSAISDRLPGVFRVVVSGDEVSRGKPDPEAYLTAAQLLGYTPAQCIAVEDSPTGTASAVAAGITTVAVPGLVAVPAQARVVPVSSAEQITAEWLRRVHREMAG
ncbi:MAG: HAD family phosphatase [Bifidobacteriaceae bacterium]|jgi:HAD superfamily hydrolase (TIGR01509 family)|nr:HAD family phosphatase [Bifidobacteriaceae bacterium]